MIVSAYHPLSPNNGGLVNELVVNCQFQALHVPIVEKLRCRACAQFGAVERDDQKLYMLVTIFVLATKIVSSVDASDDVRAGTDPL